MQSDHELLTIGLYIIDEDLMEKKSVFRTIIGIISIGLITILLITFLAFIVKVIMIPAYINAIIYIYSANFNFPRSITFFILLTIGLLTIILISLLRLFTTRSIGVLREIKGKGGRRTLTFSEAFYIAFLGSIIIVSFFPVPPPSQEIGVYEMLAYGYLATVVAPILEEGLFRLTLTLLPIAIKDWYLKRKRILGIIIGGKEKIDYIDFIVIVISSIIFGFAHQLGGWVFNKVIQAAFLGVFLGYIAVRGGIFSSIAFHWVWNALSMLLIFVILTTGVQISILLLLLVGVLYFLLMALAVLIIILVILRIFFNVII